MVPGEIVRLKDEPKKNTYRVVEIRKGNVVLIGTGGEYHNRFRTPSPDKVLEKTT